MEVNLWESISDRLWLCFLDFVKMYKLSSLHLRQNTYASHDLELFVN